MKKMAIKSLCRYYRRQDEEGRKELLEMLGEGVQHVPAGITPHMSKLILLRSKQREQLEQEISQWRGQQVSFLPATLSIVEGKVVDRFSYNSPLLVS